MSFNDPVAAFSNFRRMLKPHGRIAFSCWQALQENELDRFPLVAAGFRTAADESPFSFSDPKHVHTVLTTAGFETVAVKPHRELVTSGDVEAMTRVLLKVGPLGKIVRENPTIQLTVEPKLRKALADLGDQARAQLTASIWIVTARVLLSTNNGRVSRPIVEARAGRKSPLVALDTSDRKTSVDQSVTTTS